MIVDSAHSVDGDLSQTEFTPAHTDFARLPLPYQCAVSALTSKINILKRELTHADHYCPIRAVTSRVKSPNSILAKAARIGCPLTADDIGTNILDIAGVRVTCGLISETYRVATLLSQQADLTVIEVEDYIAHPKPNGYKSFHMVLEIPVYLSDRVERVPVELQIRTIAMDLWANLEHKIHHKHEHTVPPRLLNDLIDAADAAHRLDVTMQRLYDEVDSTLVLPFPVELLRFLEKATPQPSGAPETAGRTPAEPAAQPNGETPHVDAPPIPDDPRSLPLETVAGQPFRLNQ